MTSPTSTARGQRPAHAPHNVQLKMRSFKVDDGLICPDESASRSDSLPLVPIASDGTWS
jgi:hypothetical protein